MAYQAKLKKEVLVTVPIGLEGVAVQEMQELWQRFSLIENVQWQSFPGCLRATGLDEKAIIHVNLFSKVASRVFCKVAEFFLKQPEQFKQSVKSIPWSDFMKPEHTFRFETTWQGRLRGGREVQSWLDFNYNLNAKDSLADHFSAKFNQRPNVEKNNPDFRWRWILSPHEGQLVLAELFWDTSGQPLYYRYPERKVQKGSLHPHLANGLLRWLDYKPSDLVLDLFAGSGTFLLEAHQINTHLPNYTHLNDFAFSLWPTFRPHWPFKSQQVPLPKSHSVGTLTGAYLGIEIFKDRIQQAQKNWSPYAHSASLKVGWHNGDSLIWEKLEQVLNNEYKEWQIPATSQQKKIVLAHPPYGLDVPPEQINSLYQQLGSLAKHHLKGCTLVVFSANKEALKHIGLKPQKKLKIINEGLEAVAQQFNIY